MESIEFSKLLWLTNLKFVFLNKRIMILIKNVSYKETW